MPEHAGGHGAAFDATVTQRAGRGSRKDRAAAEFRARQIAWEDGNVAAAERAVAKARAQLDAAELALAAAREQRGRID